MTRRDTLYLEAILNGIPLNIEPLSRDELFLKAMLEGVEAPYTPETRNQVFYKAIASQWAGGSWIEQPEATSHLLQGSMAGKTRNMVIKGKTMHNLVTQKRVQAPSVIAEDEFTVNTPSSWNGKCYVGSNLLKEGTKYTIVHYIRGNTFKTPLYTYWKDKNGNTTGGTKVIPAGFNGVFTQTITTYTNYFLGDNCYWVEPGSVTEGTAKLKILILEGDFTNKFIPSYFNGITSFGEIEGEINFVGNNKNLFTKIEPSHAGWHCTYTIEGNSIHLTQTVDSASAYLGLRIPFLQKGTYFLSYDSTNTSTAHLRYKDGSALAHFVQQNKFVIPEDGEYRLYIYVGNGTELPAGSTNTISNIQIEEGTQKSAYVAPVENTKNITLPFEKGLRGNDEYWDSIDSITKKVFRRTEEIIIDGKFAWFGQARVTVGDSKGWAMQPKRADSSKLAGMKPLFADTCPILGSYSRATFGISYISMDNITFTIPDTLSGLTDASTGDEISAAMQQYLTNNPITLIVGLKTATEYPLTEDINMATYNDITHLRFNNFMQGTSIFTSRQAHQLWRFLNDLDNPLITRDELFLKAILDGVEAPFTPQTRNQILYKAIATKQATPVVAL